MRLKRITLNNFRCFEQLTVDFHPKLTVIVAENGTGKTAILEAIATGFGRLLTKLPKVGGIAPRQTDIRIESGGSQAPFMNVLLDAETDAPKGEVQWTIHKNRDNSVRTAKAVASQLSPEIAKIGQKQIDKYASSLAEAVDDYSTGLINAENSGNAYFLPVVAYYGTDRAVLDEARPRKNSKRNFSRFDALAGALQGKARFNAAIEWFAFMEDAERRAQQEQRDFDYRLSALNTVRSAIINTLPVGFSNPHTEIRPFRFVIDRLTPDGVKRSYLLDQLSDGFRIMLALVMDLARRMAQANSLLAPGGNPIVNPLDLPAIVLIDEVDLHLHPQWQQTVLADLTRTFRGTQFIVTTHSPQVLTTVKAECIRGLKSVDGKVVVKDDYQFSEGAESQLALEDILGVSPRPQNLDVVKQLNAYLDLVAKDQWDTPDAAELRSKLDEWGHGHETALIKADMDIRMRQYRRERGNS